MNAPRDWVFLRGLTRESRHWGTLPLHWRSAGLGKPLLVDLPGNGTLAAQATPPSVAAMMESVRQSVRAAGLRAPPGVLAMSLGAMVAAQWARAYPGELAALVLINTSMRPFSGMTRRLRPRNWPTLLRMAMAWEDRAYCERQIHRITCARTDTRVEDIQAWIKIAGTAPVSRRSALHQLLAAACFRADSSAPRCPTLLLGSAADQLVNPACSASIARAWAVPLCRHPWAGHDLPHDDPQWVCQTVRRSLYPE